MSPFSEHVVVSTSKPIISPQNPSRTYSGTHTIIHQATPLVPNIPISFVSPTFSAPSWITFTSTRNSTGSKILSCPLLSLQPFCRNITTLKITIRRGDGSWNKLNEALAIDPYRRDANMHQMRQDMQASQRGEQAPNWVNGRRASAIANMPKLETLEIEFETSEERKEKLRNIVERAPTPEFPMGERGVWSTRENTDSRSSVQIQNTDLADVKVWEWRGKSVYLSVTCSYCVNNSCIRTAPAGGKNGDRLKKRLELMREEGPMLVVMEIR